MTQTPHYIQYVVEKEPHNVTWRVRPFQGSHSLLVAVGIPIILFSLYRVIMRLNCSIVQRGGGLFAMRELKRTCDSPLYNLFNFVQKQRRKSNRLLFSVISIIRDDWM